ASLLLLGLLAMAWLDQPLAYAALGLITLAALYSLSLAGVPLGSAASLGWLAVLGFGFYLAARLAGMLRATRLGGLWETPLNRAARVLAGVGALALLSPQGGSVLVEALALALAGAQALGEAYRLRRLRPSYLGVALLLVAWMLVLVDRQVAQPQW